MRKNPQTRNKLQSGMDDLFNAYNQCVEPFFSALDTNLDDERFRTLRANYFFRISTTPSLIAEIALRAVHRRDWKCAESTLKDNLKDELGNLEFESPHLALLSYSFNKLGKRCFSLEPIEIAELNVGQTGDKESIVSDDYQLITAETIAFRAQLNELMKGDDDVAILGASYAQEKIAHTTLTRLHKLFLDRPGNPRLVPPEDAYFIAHLQAKANTANTGKNEASEEVHARQALANLRRLCINSRRKDAVNRALHGADLFLKGQQKLLLSLLKNPQSSS